MSRIITLAMPTQGSPHPYSRVFSDGFLMDNEGDGTGTLLAVSLVAPQKDNVTSVASNGQLTQKKYVPEDVFKFVFENTDTYMGGSKHDPRVKAINLEKSPWEFETSHLVCHWARVPGLSSRLVRDAGGRYDSSAERLMADTSEKLEELLKEFKATDVEKHVMGSSHQRIIGRSHALMGKGKTGESEAFYLYGPTLDAARKKFFPVLLAMEIPMLAEWDDHFWKLFQSAGWVKTLTGFRMAGYKIDLNRDAVCALISQEIKARHEFLRPPTVPSELWV